MFACWSTRLTTSPHAWVGARRPNGWMSGREDGCRLTSPLAEEVDRKLRNNEGSGEGSSDRVIADPAPLNPAPRRTSRRPLLSRERRSRRPLLSHSRIDDTMTAPNTPPFPPQDLLYYNPPRSLILTPPPPPAS